jgi:predicted nucleic acid-binding protein
MSGMGGLRRGGAVSTTTGTLGVLLAAGARGLADSEALFRRLVLETSFRTTPEVREMFIAECAKITRKDPE